MTLFISIKRQVIVNNHNNNRSDPPYEVRTSKTDTAPQRVSSLTLTGTIRLVYAPADPLVSGAVAWIEVDQAPVGLTVT